ncbi:proclotting enzyme-like [Oppia nitens]|uniref:proclotting enzyme-like n=1 Tax=Oppia nitens TaxID=1686743 RepID=UPI0023DB4BA0|nr:proclotting enzyme-like [Oppia nitens]
MSLYTIILWCILLTLINCRYYHRLRHLRLEDSFCTAYQELKDDKCSARLSSCSPLKAHELNQMRQILCGFRFDPSVQTEPPAPTNNNPHYYPKHFADVFEADIHYYRFIASIYSSNREFQCAGALVSPRTVVTAAQCVSPAVRKRKKRQEEEEQTPVEQIPEGDAGRLIVRFGEQHLNINPTFKNVYEYDVESIEISQHYDPISHSNDIAIIRLVNPVPICKFPPIHIPRKFEYWLDYQHIAGCSATYLGWGLKNQKPYFRALTGEVLSHHFCQKLFNWDYHQLNRSHLCVDSPSGVCVSDTGGPLITYANDRWVLIGLLTFGKHCRTPGLPLIFSRITESMDEIYKYIDQDFNSRNATLLHEECHHQNHFHAPIYPDKHTQHIKPIKPLIVDHSLDHKLHPPRGAVLPIEHIDYDYINQDIQHVKEVHYK